MNVHRFPPFWQHGRNVSRCDKVVTITLLIWYLSSKYGFEVRILSTRQIWQICLKTMNFYRIDTWKSLLQGKNENIQKVYSIGLWICLPWDFCASSWQWDCPQNRWTWEVCRSGFKTFFTYRKPGVKVVCLSSRSK